MLNTVYYWCILKYGVNGTAPSFHVDDEFFYITKEEKGRFLHEENKIVIKRDTITESIKTMIHEWQHYLQPKDQFETLYNLGYTKETHPFEVVAELIAERDWQECFHWTTLSTNKQTKKGT
jgi:hypothetical protein